MNVVITKNQKTITLSSEICNPGEKDVYIYLDIWFTTAEGYLVSFNRIETPWILPGVCMTVATEPKGYLITHKAPL